MRSAHTTAGPAGRRRKEPINSAEGTGVEASCPWKWAPHLLRKRSREVGGDHGLWSVQGTRSVSSSVGMRLRISEPPPRSRPCARSWAGGRRSPPSLGRTPQATPMASAHSSPVPSLVVTCPGPPSEQDSSVPAWLGAHRGARAPADRKLSMRPVLSLLRSHPSTCRADLTMFSLSTSSVRARPRVTDFKTCQIHVPKPPFHPERLGLKMLRWPYCSRLPLGQGLRD